MERLQIQLKIRLPSPNKAVHIEMNTMRNVSDHIVQTV